MYLHPPAIPPVPEATAQVARAAFPKGNLYMQMRDQLGSIYTDDLFADLYPPEGQPTISPWRLALVTVLQFAENLSDRQAAEAVRSRIDWKYALVCSRQTRHLWENLCHRGSDWMGHSFAGYEFGLT